MRKKGGYRNVNRKFAVYLYCVSSIYVYEL